MNYQEIKESKMTEEELLSKTISAVRFPMAFLVVMIHGHFSRIVLNGGITEMDFSNFLVFPKVTLLVGEIASVAVPVFYILSGFLFFYNVSEFNRCCFVSKMKKRVNSLLIPYLFWNFFALLIAILGQSFIPSVFSGERTNIFDYSWIEWLQTFWNNAGTGYPVSSQLWFLRDLMIVVVASPIIYLFVKYTRAVGVLILWGLWVLGIESNITGINITSFFFFSLGAFFSIHKVNFVSLSTHLFKNGIGILYLLLLLSAVILENTIYSPYLHKGCISVGIFFVIALISYYLLKGGKDSTFLSKSSMFIYLFHAAPIIFLKKIVIMITQPSNDITALLVYFFCPIVMTIISLSLFWILRRNVPKFTSFITGGRV